MVLPMQAIYADQSPDHTSDQATVSTDSKDNPLEQVVGLVLQEINLFQGAKGLELWRLHATWAHLSQDGDVINVGQPHVRYALGDSGLPDEEEIKNAPQDVIDVTAKAGQITDHQRHLSLTDEVIVTRLDNTIHSQRMEYDSNTRIMLFPQGAVLENNRGSGTVSLLEWNLDKNEITATQGVEVILKPRTAPQNSQHNTPQK